MFQKIVLTMECKNLVRRKAQVYCREERSYVQRLDVQKHSSSVQEHTKALHMDSWQYLSKLQILNFAKWVGQQ